MLQDLAVFPEAQDSPGCFAADDRAVLSKYDANIVNERRIC